MNENPRKFKDHDPARDASAMVSQVTGAFHLPMPRKPLSAPGPKQSYRSGVAKFKKGYVRSHTKKRDGGLSDGY